MPGQILVTCHNLTSDHTWQLLTFLQLLIARQLVTPGNNLATGHNLSTGHNLPTGHNISTGHNFKTCHNLGTGQYLITGHSWHLVTPRNWSHPSPPKFDLGLSPCEDFTSISPKVWEEIGLKNYLFTFFVYRML